MEDEPRENTSSDEQKKWTNTWMKDNHLIKASPTKANQRLNENEGKTVQDVSRSRGPEREHGRKLKITSSSFCLAEIRPTAII